MRPEEKKERNLKHCINVKLPSKSLSIFVFISAWAGNKQSAGHFHAALPPQCTGRPSGGLCADFVMVMYNNCGWVQSGEDTSDNDGLYVDSKNLLRSYN